ncbi:TRAP transporter large permease [Acidaminococcus sp. DS4831]|uniref:TRAP transporter large permease n=1 Tax=Acidaminococcus sp. DS4831 TaxID=3141399 RepID=UPI0032E5086D
MLGLLFGTFFILLALGVPILFSMGIAAGIYYFANGYPLMQFVQKTVAGVDSFTLLAIPFFLLAGDIMGKGGISKRMLRFANALVGPLTGGLAVTGVFSSAMFGTICGSAPATAASIGSIIAPDMLNHGYKKRFTGSIIAASGLLGIIIPPSIVMVNYGATAGVSIGKLFIGGIIPGILAAFGLAGFSIYQAKKYGYGLVDGKKQEYSLTEIVESFRGAILPLTTPLFILGSIMFGIATATEAAVISVVWSAFLTVCVYRELSLRELCTVLTDGAGKAGQIIGMMASSAAFGYALTVEKVPAMMAKFFVQYVDNVAIFFLITFFIVLILGCFLEVIAIIVLVTPILLPVASAMHVNPIHFGMFMCLALCLGGLTPPVGLCLITTSELVGVDIDKMFPDLLYCILIYCAVIALVGLFPPLSTYLPSLMITGPH